jgi:hypothetical protein
VLDIADDRWLLEPVAVWSRRRGRRRAAADLRRCRTI